uniref:DUF19 domain-containing protein n=1 Tax=Parastrongyloides trichosuri TaxID=131310 RepID=A0A0N4Z4Z8_PARTI
MGNEWTADFAFPLIALVHVNSSIEIAYIKAQEICFENDNLKNCLNKCPNSDERKLLITGLKPWEDICRNLKQLKPHFTCWRLNLETLAISCHVENSKLRSNLRSFSTNRSIALVKNVCLSFDELSSCSLKDYKKYCGNATSKLLQKFYETSKYAVNEMLKFKFTILPEECENDKDRERMLSLEQNLSIKYIVFNYSLLFLLIFSFLYYFSY